MLTQDLYYNVNLNSNISTQSRVRDPVSMSIPMMQIAPVGFPTAPTKGGPVILNLYFKKTSTWPATVGGSDGKTELSQDEINERCPCSTFPCTHCEHMRSMLDPGLQSF